MYIWINTMYIWINNHSLKSKKYSHYFLQLYGNNKYVTINFQILKSQFFIGQTDFFFRIPKSDPMEAKLQEMLRVNIEKSGGQTLDTLADSRR